MLRLATLMVGSVPLAEEVVQEAFAQVSLRWVDVARRGAYLRASVVRLPGRAAPPGDRAAHGRAAAPAGGS